ncbi:MAG: patatin-like phospholipase family protein [Gemmataceae bacterium]
MRQGRKVAAILAVLMLSAGCLDARHYPPPNLPPSARLIPAEQPPAELPTVVTASARPSRTVLAISGGGLCGAYTAGVLKGWTAAGTRPQFDVVTGVSTGALIAPLAFLGPDSDAQLEEWYTGAKPSDIYRRRSLPAWFWADSLADSAPLKQRIEAVVTEEFLARVAQAHNAGRRLYVGTTDLDSKRLVVWDMGAIAAGEEANKLELFRTVLLASCAIPGLLSPVSIDIEVNGKRRTELHVDGGVSAAAFLPPVALAGDLGPGTRSNRETTVNVIVSGKVVGHGRPVARRLVDVSEESLNGLLRAQVRGDLQRIALQAQKAGATFGFTAVPDDFGVGESATLNPQMLRRLFDEGYKFGSSRTAWRQTAPGLEVNEPPPRTGTRFRLIKAGAKEQ